LDYKDLIEEERTCYAYEGGDAVPLKLLLEIGGAKRSVIDARIPLGFRGQAISTTIDYMAESALPSTIKSENTSRGDDRNRDRQRRTGSRRKVLDGVSVLRRRLLVEVLGRDELEACQDDEDMIRE